MQRLSQNDPRWANTRFGVAGSTLTIGSHGCVVTSLANLTGSLNPVEVARQTSYVPDANIIWDSINNVQGLDLLHVQWDGDYKTIQHRTAQGEGCIIQILLNGGKHYLSVLRLENENIICIDPWNPWGDTVIHMSRVKQSVFVKVDPVITAPPMTRDEAFIKFVQGNGGSSKSKQLLLDAWFQNNGEYLHKYLPAWIKEWN
jgi:hypothetical protein